MKSALNIRFVALIFSALMVCSYTSIGKSLDIVNHDFYQIVIDAGSSGSRLYIYEGTIGQNSMEIFKDIYDIKVNIPLASANQDPAVIKDTLGQLMQGATEYLNSENIPITAIKVNVLGTAGMRLLSENDQSKIYKEVTTFIANFKPNNFKVGVVKTITGQDEGVYSWVDVNYLQHNFSNNGVHTKGIFEMGGASSQIVFAVNTIDFDKNNDNILKIMVNNHEYYVYSKSFLGLGQDQARSTMKNLPDNFYCYPKGYQDGQFNYDKCTNNYEQVIRSQSDYSQLTDISSISGFKDTKFIGVSSIFYALNFWSIANAPQQLEHNISITCNEPYPEIKNKYSTAFKLENQCANAVYVNDMIFHQLKFNSDQIVAEDIIDNTPLSYTLGFVFLNH